MSSRSTTTEERIKVLEKMDIKTFEAYQSLWLKNLSLEWLV